LKNHLKCLLIILDDFYKYSGICVENNIIWENFEEQIWKKLLITNGFRDPMPELSRIIEISNRAKKRREKNTQVYIPLPEHSPTITLLYRNTAWARYEKQQQLKSILKKIERKPIHRFYPRISERYKNFKNRRVA
jgi:hypothetical protein